MTLPTDPKARKAIPIYSGFIKYFPDAIVAVAELSRIGNDQHNPGKDLFWDRSKSGDELDALMRHLTDEAAGVPVDTDGVMHLTKTAWRSMAALQKALEKQLVPVAPVDAEHAPNCPCWGCEKRRRDVSGAWGTVTRITEVHEC